MNILFSAKALRDYEDLPREIKKIVDKQFDFLLRDVWQARINQGWRFYFRIKGDTYHIVTIIRHPK